MASIKYGSFGSNQSVLRSATSLDDSQILRVAPSIFATEAHESRGERYRFIPTSEVLSGLRANGFQPFEVRQTRVRDLGKKEHTKHLIRLRHADSIQTRAEVPELILVNSHDGSSSYQLLAGVFRMICSNGLIAGDICDDVRIRHSGNVVNDVIEGSFRVLNNLEEVEQRIDQYKAITVSREEQIVLANAVAEVRWGDESPVLPERLLAPRRWEDRKDDLWTVSNRLQESIIQGGVSGRSANGRRTSTRAVQGVTENVRLNKAIWSLTDHFAKLKEAA